ncbi:MAG: hypothetical protein GEU94_15180 [Micromonosporaceae bacterium]|nr:hypothetical protein [Micromonosporaceae bacterium]
MVDVQDVRWAALSLPETTERSSYGMPSFQVRDKLFARIREQGDAVVVWCANETVKHTMATSDPTKFCTTPQYDGYPMVLVRLEAVNVTEVSQLLSNSWRLRAPANLVAAADAFAGQRSGPAPPGF